MEMSVVDAASKLTSEEQEFRDACTVGDVDKLETIVEVLTDEELEHILSNKSDYRSGTPLFEAVMCGQTAAVRYLIEMESDLELECDVSVIYPMVYNDVGAVLCVASATGNRMIVEMLLNAAADVNHASKYSNSLINACKYSYNTLVELLLSHDANPNFQLGNGKTPLHVACESSDNIFIVRMLIAYGADIYKLDNDGKAPLFYACLKGNCEMAELLLQYDGEMCLGTEYIEYLWLLGAACACSEDWGEVLRYWRWAADDEKCHVHYRDLVNERFTDDQITCGIVSAGFAYADMERMAYDQLRLRLHALVVLALLLNSDNPLLLMLYSDLASDFIDNKSIILMFTLQQLTTFGNGIVEKSQKPGSLCDCLNSIVDSLLNAYETHKLDLLPIFDLEPSLYILLKQLVDSFSALTCMKELSPLDSFVAMADMPHSTRQLTDVIQEIMESVIAVSGLIFKYSSSAQVTTIRNLVPILSTFVVDAKKRQSYLDSLIWGILIDLDYCQYSLTWVYSLLFPSVSLIEAFISAGLDVNSRDKQKKTALHMCILAKSVKAPQCEVMLITFLNEGALIDLPDNKGIRPCDLIAAAKYQNIRPVHHRTLKSFCAEVIVESSLPYKSLPKALQSYVDQRVVGP